MLPPPLPQDQLLHLLRCVLGLAEGCVQCGTVCCVGRCRPRAPPRRARPAGSGTSHQLPQLPACCAGVTTMLFALCFMLCYLGDVPQARRLARLCMPCLPLASPACKRSRFPCIMTVCRRHLRYACHRRANAPAAGLQARGMPALVIDAIWCGGVGRVALLRPLLLPVAAAMVAVPPLERRRPATHATSSN